MSKSQHTEAQMIGALKQLEAWQKAEGAREVGILKRTTYAWKATHNRRMWGRRQEAKQLGLRTRSHESG